MTIQKLSETQLANIKFHRLLAPQYERQPFFQEANRDRVRALLEELTATTPAKRLLDIGCGTGLILDLTHDLFEELDGIDITPEMLERIKPRPNVRAQLASAEEIPFADSTFDAITAYSVLHHIENLAPVFREVRRTLKPGGFFYADESPSQAYLECLFKLRRDAEMSATVRNEFERVTHDAEEYEKRYGIPQLVAQRAMTQNFSHHALEQENIEHLLKSAGFQDVRITFRRFIGEDQCRQTGGQEEVKRVYNYLVEMFPLTCHLFKYFVLVAR